jgi:hypothetical protein
MKGLRRSLRPALLCAAGLAAGLSAVPADAQVGITIQLGQPGYYGPVQPYGIGPNQLLYPQPRIIQPGYRAWDSGRTVQPIYLRVPPGHAKNWGKYCQRYGSCNRPVYFVRDSWYNDTYGQRYQQQKKNYRRGRGRYRYDDD